MCSCLLVVSGQSFADPQSVDVGGGKLIPQLSVGLKSDDNIFSQAFAEESDVILNVKPSVQWLQEKNASSVALTYTGDYAVYRDSDDDNYDDHTFSVDGHFSPTDMFRADVGASYGFLHENRGEGASEGVVGLFRDEPDEYEIANLNGRIDLGRESAMFGAAVIAYVNDIEYQNNRVETQFRDRDEAYIAGRVYGKLSGGKTQFFLEVSEEDFEYDTTPLVGGPLDSTEWGWAIGAEWEATAKTTGSIKIGEIEKEFDFSPKGDDTVTVWDLDLTWSPRTYSSVFLSASNTPNETNGTGTFIEQRDYSVTWMHGWSELLTSTISVAIGDDEFFNSAREDERDNYSIGLTYSMKRWMTLGATISRSERDSNLNRFDFERNIVSVNVDMSL